MTREESIAFLTQCLEKIEKELKEMNEDHNTSCTDDRTKTE